MWRTSPGRPAVCCLHLQVQALRGHDNNVVDLTWSPDGSLLASASLDNTVIIWEPASGRRVTTLTGHHGFVKGVAWDPFNVFLATQASGRNVGLLGCRDVVLQGDHAVGPPRLCQG